MHRTLVRGILLYIALGFMVKDAIGLDIQFNIIDVGQNPTYDSNAAKLADIAAVAEAYYEDAIKDSWALPIDLYWETDMPPSYLADAGRLVTDFNTTTYGYKERATWGRIRFHADRNIFLDATPSNSAEFNIEQEMFRDLPTINQDYAFPNGAPDFLEVTLGSLDESTTMPPASYDALAIMFHEIGHILGIYAGDETSDGDYDFLAHQVGGASVSRITVPGDESHLSCCGGFPANLGGAIANKRFFPTATDILAMASSAGWMNVDLPRKELIAGPDWNTATNWVGGRVPDAADEVTVRTGAIATLSGAAVAGTLRVLESTTLSNSAQSLAVSEDLLVGSGGKLFVTGDAAITVGGVATYDSAIAAFKLSTSEANEVDADSAVIDSSVVELRGDPAEFDIGDTFSILAVDDAVFGQFDEVSLLTAAGSAMEYEDYLAYDLLPAVVYTNQTFSNPSTLVGRESDGVIVRMTLPGDFNLDNTVSNADLTILLDFWGDSRVTWREGDATGDGQVTMADYNILSDYWGETAGGGGGPVPEPATSAILMMAMIGCANLRRRR